MQVQLLKEKYDLYNFVTNTAFFLLLDLCDYLPNLITQKSFDSFRYLKGRLPTTVCNLFMLGIVVLRVSAATLWNHVHPSI